MAKKLKILAAGDIHGDRKLAKGLADLAEKESVDLVILNGDLVNENNTEGIVGQFKQKNKNILILSQQHKHELFQFSQL